MNRLVTYPLVILGAGSGGLTAARVAAEFGVRVALLEASDIGGDCLHTGCVPSKSLISLARKLQASKELNGIMDVQHGALDFAKVHSYIHDNIDTITKRSDNPESLKAAGVDVIKGHFTFKNARELVSDDGNVVRFKKCIIASGSEPIVPQVPGLSDVPFLTSDNLWGLQELPKSLAVIGAGPIGLELGQAFAMLGSNVTVFEQGETLVPRLGGAAGAAVQAGLEEAGVRIIFNSKVKQLEKTNDGVRIAYETAEPQTADFTHVLIATGRSPRTKTLGVENTRIKLAERGGIIADTKLRTAHKHIYAVGDVLGGPLFTHWAAEQGAFAAIHALFGTGNAPDSAILPSATFTTPEVSQVGRTEEALQSARITYRKLELPYAAIDKAVAEQEQGGVTVLLGKNDAILGATIIGTNASELIGYFVYAMQRGDNFHSLASGVQAYPTYTINIKELAGLDRISQFKHKGYVKLLLKLRGLR